MQIRKLKGSCHQYNDDYTWFPAPVFTPLDLIARGRQHLPPLDRAHQRNRSVNMREILFLLVQLDWSQNRVFLHSWNLRQPQELIWGLITICSLIHNVVDYTLCCRHSLQPKNLTVQKHAEILSRNFPNRYCLLNTALILPIRFLTPK